MSDVNCKIIIWFKFYWSEKSFLIDTFIESKFWIDFPDQFWEGVRIYIVNRIKWIKQ